MALPKQKPPAPTRYCRCGARIARDNPEDECSPCQHSETRRARESTSAAEELRNTRAREIYRQRTGLNIEDVPLSGEDDRLGAECVRDVVFTYARMGSYHLAAEYLGMNVHEVRACIRRSAARETIDYLIEEGLWPEESPQGKRT